MMINTFFDKRFVEIKAKNGVLPFNYRLRNILDNITSENDESYGVEAFVFEQILDHEFWLYEPRGRLVGNIEIFEDSALVYRGNNEIPYLIPSFVESDFCRFGCSNAKFIVVTTDFISFDMLQPFVIRNEMDIILILTSGVPRFVARRFIRRLQEHTKRQVLFLSDNDTWGYFSYSILLRGCLNANQIFKYASIQDCRFIGINAFQARHLAESGCPTREWKDSWTERMNALKQYDCFASKDWQYELNQFINNGFAISLHEVISRYGFQWIVDGVCSCSGVLSSDQKPEACVEN